MLCDNGAACLCAASLCFLITCSQSGHGFTVTDGHRAEQHRGVSFLGLYGFKASFTDRLYGVRGFALTVGNVSKLFPYSLCASAFSSSPGRSAGALMPHSADRHADLLKEFKELQVSDR